MNELRAERASLPVTYALLSTPSKKIGLPLLSVVSPSGRRLETRYRGGRGPHVHVRHHLVEHLPGRDASGLLNRDDSFSKSHKRNGKNHGADGRNDQQLGPHNIEACAAIEDRLREAHKMRRW
jgi:hypothetical protein